MNGMNGNRGFALPMALLVLLVSAGAVLVTLTQVSTERRLSDSAHNGLEALLLAETGLERFQTAYGTADPEWSGFVYPPATILSTHVDSARVMLPGGFADVTMRQLKPAVVVGNVPAVFLLRSRGVRTTGGWAGAPEGVRVVTRIVRWVPGTAHVPAAWTAIGGLEKAGAAGTLSGVDACAIEADAAGVGVPTDPGLIGSSASVSSIDIMGPTPEDAAAAVDIDWASIVAGTGMPFDMVLSNSGTVPLLGVNEWPIIYVDNPGETWDLNRSGQGTLIVRGNMRLPPTRTWQGLILVGGSLRSDGTATVEGGAISGLNVKLGETAPTSDVGNGTKIFQYNSCHVRRALQAYTRMHVMDNTWLDNAALY